MAALALGLTFALSGCGDTKLSWTEQVRLQDGSILVVERDATFTENRIAGGGGGAFNKGMSLRIPVLPTGNKIDEWHDYYVPILLERDLVTQEWVLIATFFHCDSWVALGRPTLPYAEFRFRQGHWIREALDPSLIGRPANLLLADLGDRSAIGPGSPLLTIERKQALLEASPGISPKYLRIVNQWSTTC